MRRLVIGVGHPFRGDDAVGLKVAEAVAALELPDTDVITHHGEGTDLMERWSGYDAACVVDATWSGAEAGTIRVWDARTAALPAGLFPKGSHVFGVVEGVEMARLLGRLPEFVLAVGIEAENFDQGESISAAVKAAIPEAARIIEGLFRDL
ncbi:MAG: hydrogenase maturation protease [Solirubrobacterales bacterium]